MNKKNEPFLVSNKTIKKLGRLFQVPVIKEKTWQEHLYIFYDDNIRPNLIAIIIFFILGVFLTIKYILKQQKDERNLLRKRKKNIKRKLLLKKQQNNYIQLDDTNISNITGNIDEDSNNYDVIINTDIDTNKIIDDDIYYRASDHEFSDFSDDKENRSDDEFSYYGLSQKYSNIINNNDGSIPTNMLLDELADEKKKATFNNMAKYISGY
jgi:hypothetical protein